MVKLPVTHYYQFMETKINNKYNVAMAQKIELWNVARLIPYEKNAREHSPEQVAQIAASIVEFGFLNPILVDSKDGIVAGHGRLSAAKELALDVVPVVVLDHLTENQKKAYILVDNKLAENATWNEDLLAEEIIKLNLQDFDLNILGWSDEELKALQEDGWASDIEDLTKNDNEHLDGIQAKITILLDEDDKEKVVDALNEYCNSNDINIEIK